MGVPVRVFSNVSCRIVLSHLRFRCVGNIARIADIARPALAVLVVGVLRTGRFHAA